MTKGKQVTIFGDVTKHLAQRFTKFLFQDEGRLTEEHLRYLASAVDETVRERNSRGLGPRHPTFGFIDGT